MKYQLQTEFTLQDLNTIERTLRVNGQDRLAKKILDEIDEIEQELEIYDLTEQCNACGVDINSGTRCDQCSG